VSFSFLSSYFLHGGGEKEERKGTFVVFPFLLLTQEGKRERKRGEAEEMGSDLHGRDRDGRF